MTQRSGGLAGQRLGFLLTLPVLVLVVIFTVYPFGYAFYQSFVSNVIYRPQEIGQWNDGRNYASVVSSSYFTPALVNTLIFTAAATGLIILTALAVTELLNNKFRGAGLFRFLIFIPWAIPSAAAGVIWRQMFQTSGWLNKTVGLFGVLDGPIYFLAQDQSFLVLLAALTQLWQQLPFAVLLLTAVYQLIPREVVDSALVDGASGFKLFRKVTFPYLKTALAILVVFEALLAVHTFDLVYTFTGGVWGLISFYSFAEGFNFGNLGNGAALSVIVALITLGLVGAILFFLPPEKMYRYSFLREE